MGLFGSKMDVEDLLYSAVSLMEKSQPNGATHLAAQQSSKIDFRR